MATIIRVRTEMVGVPGSPYLSNMYFASSADPQEAASHVGSFWTGVSGFMTNDLAGAVDPTVFDVDATTGEVVGSTTTTGATFAGTSDVEKLSPALQLLCRWRTGVYTGGREIRGKTFIPGLTQTANDDGVVLATVVTDLNTFLEDWLALGPPLLIWSRKNGTTAPVASGSPWGQFSVLRSRRD